MKVHLTAPPWTLGRREGAPPYHHTLDFRRQGRWGGGDYGTFQLQVSGRGGGGPESEVPMRFSSSALVRPSVTHGGTLRARRRPANGRRRSPAIIRTGSAQGTFQRSTLPPHLGPSAGEKAPPYHHTLDFRRQGRCGGGDLEGPTMARYLGKVPWQGGTGHFDLAFKFKFTISCKPLSARG